MLDFAKFGIKYVGFYPKQRGTLKRNDNKFQNCIRGVNNNMAKS